MKLNPFSKKSNPYLDKVKSEHDALNLELTPLKAELAEAPVSASATRSPPARPRECGWVGRCRWGTTCATDCW